MRLVGLNYIFVVYFTVFIVTPRQRNIYIYIKKTCAVKENKITFLSTINLHEDIHSKDCYRPGNTKQAIGEGLMHIGAEEKKIKKRNIQLFFFAMFSQKLSYLTFC